MPHEMVGCESNPNINLGFGIKTHRVFIQFICKPQWSNVLDAVNKDHILLTNVK